MKQIWRCPKCAARNTEQFVVGYEPLYCVYCNAKFRYDLIEFIQDFDDPKDCPGQLSFIGEWL